MLTKSLARRILDKYRPQMACFNDDVQGTGCVTLAAILAGLHISKVKLEEMRVVVFGSVCLSFYRIAQNCFTR